MRRKAWIAIVVAATTGAGLLLCWPTPVPRTSGPLHHEAYIWQRTWPTDMKERLSGTADSLEGFVILAAEISWPGNTPMVTVAQIDYTALRRCGCPTGLAVRINEYRGSFAPSADAAKLISGVAQSVIHQAREAGVHVSELQLDFDCPESKLDGYRNWVLAIRDQIGDLPLAITVLPSWLDNANFAPLARAAGAFVLQVHALKKPRSIRDIPALCDPARSRRWVEQAAKVSVPFRVALPTYSYMLAFDASGTYLGATAETPNRTWPGDAQFRLLAANPTELATLVRDWTNDRPANMKGVLWYRLPVETDRLNFRWQTLQAILAGRSPQADLNVKTRPVEPGLVEVDILNTGDADANLDVGILLQWRGPAPIARDALGLFEDSGDFANNQWTLRRRTEVAPAVLPPGENMTVAWLRFDSDREVRAHVTTNSD